MLGGLEFGGSDFISAVFLAPEERSDAVGIVFGEGEGGLDFLGQDQSGKRDLDIPDGREVTTRANGRRVKRKQKRIV